jgi:N-[(2S)-2-amino-2-carboxyethyl]-L-glutamate dehydrogenase
MRVILDSHSDLSAGAESYLGLPIKINPSYLANQFDLSEELINILLQIYENRADFIDKFSDMCLKQTGKNRWVDKTARNIHTISNLINIFPNAKFIHVLRDGKDVIASLKTHKKRWKNPDTKKIENTGFIMPIDLSIQRWKKSVQDFEKIKDFHQVITVKYEDLIYNNRKEIIRVCDFLEINFQDAMMDFHEIHTPYRDAHNKFIQNIEATKPLNKTRVGRWRKDLSFDDQIEMMSNIHRELRQCNYDAGEKVLIYESVEIEKCFKENPQLAQESLEEALKIHAEKKLIQPQKVYIQRSLEAHTSDRTIAMPLHSENNNNTIQGIKWIGSHPDNTQRGLSRANAIITLNDPLTNAPMAILDGSEISARRTTAFSELVINKFIKSNVKILILGTGNLGKMHIETLSSNSKVSDIMFWNKKTTVTFNDFPKAFSVSLEEGLLNADIIISLTNANIPYIKPSMLTKANQIIINLSLMDFSTECYDSAQLIIVDDKDQCKKGKKIYKQWLEQNYKNEDNVKEISSMLVNNEKLPSGRIIFNPLGMAIEDIVLTHKIFELLPKSLNQKSLTMRT